METTTNKTRFALYGLYVITPCSSIQPLSTFELLDKIQCAIEGGARIVQYREKLLPASIRREQALAIKTLCERYNVCFLVNDDVPLAAEVGAHGVHLGQKDAPLANARNMLGDSAIIGISCYNRLELARTAQAAGADYIAFGRFFSSSTKPDAVQADVQLLIRAKSELWIPVACIGGITANNAKLLIAAGADMLVVINAVFGAEDVKQAAQELAECF
ncbi:MAG: thiamine phosphate synthase [Gammaproteobacteria bacterium]|nr:thiamine phosphate synthase [Gammaproteobacteria bacterium]